MGAPTSTRFLEFLKLKNQVRETTQEWERLNHHWVSFDYRTKQRALEKMSISAYKLMKFLDSRDESNPWYCFTCAPNTVNFSQYIMGECSRCGCGETCVYRIPA